MLRRGGPGAGGPRDGYTVGERRGGGQVRVPRAGRAGALEEIYPQIFQRIIILRFSHISEFLMKYFIYQILCLKYL